MDERRAPPSAMDTDDDEHSMRSSTTPPPSCTPPPIPPERGESARISGLLRAVPCQADTTDNDTNTVSGNDSSNDSERADGAPTAVTNAPSSASAVLDASQLISTELALVSPPPPHLLHKPLPGVAFDKGLDAQAEAAGALHFLRFAVLWYEGALRYCRRGRTATGNVWLG